MPCNKQFFIWFSIHLSKIHLIKQYLKTCYFLLFSKWTFLYHSVSCCFVPLLVIQELEAITVFLASDLSCSSEAVSTCEISCLQIWLKSLSVDGRFGLFFSESSFIQISQIVFEYIIANTSEVVSVLLKSSLKLEKSTFLPFVSGFLSTCSRFTIFFFIWVCFTLLNSFFGFFFDSFSLHLFLVFDKTKTKSGFHSFNFYYKLDLIYNCIFMTNGVKMG